MSLSNLRAMFEHIAEFYAENPKRMDFVWHGGEPLLIKPTYYEQILSLQHEAFDSCSIPFTNSVQTNLTNLNDKVIAFLKTGFFSNIGVSLDVYGGQRITASGIPAQPIVLANMQTLIKEGIPFGCITVLSQETAPFLEDIYHFFEDIDVSFRLLPIYRTGFEHQQDQLALANQDIVKAFKKAVDIWFSSESSIQVRPILDYIAHVVSFLEGQNKNQFYNKLDNEVVYIVEPDGSLYSVADPPDVSLCHGNIFNSSLQDLNKSEGHLRAVYAAEARVESTCSECKFYGNCSGYFMGEATPEQRTIDNAGKLECSVARPLQDYVEHKLRDSGLFNSRTNKFTEWAEFRTRLSEGGGLSNFN